MDEPNDMDFIRTTKQPKRVAVGDRIAARDLALLKKNKICAIVTVRSRLSHSAKKYNQHGISVLHIPVNDHHRTNLFKHFPTAYKFIDQQTKEGNILIHCAAGISRSVTICLSYLMRKYGWGLEKALRNLRKCRPIANPNPGFIRQLQKHEKVLKAQGVVKSEKSEKSEKSVKPKKSRKSSKSRRHGRKSKSKSKSRSKSKSKIVTLSKKKWNK